MNFIKLIVLFFSLPVFAEYRVYQYLIKSKNITHQVSTGDAQIEISTYDPQTFTRYHGGQSAVDVTLQRTWMCEGYTGKKRNYCPHPGERNSI